MCSRCEGHAWRGGGLTPVSRRELIRRSAAGAVMVGLSGGALGAIARAGGTTVRAPYGSGFCSLALFLAHARQIAAEDGVALELVPTPTFADHVTFIGAGVVDVSVTPYTSVIALRDAGAAVKIVAGGGIEGCGIVSQPGLDAPEKLRGTTLGTFQMDSLEVMAYDWLRANGIGFDEIRVRYMGATPEAVEAFKAGALDWICTIEPYVTALARDVAGAHVLSRGRDIHGAGYTDCVLTANVRSWNATHRR
jgi:NitT/TauT family transport system substrate-binding protein